MTDFLYDWRYVSFWNYNWFYDHEVTTWMIEREILFSNFCYHMIEHFRQWNFDLSSFFHIFELADSLLCLHDTDHEDKSGTNFVCFF